MRAEVASVILCDDARKEVSGKDILIGVFSGGIEVQAYPIMIVTTLWIEIEPDDVGTILCSFKIDTPSGNPPPGVSFDLDVRSKDTAVFVMNGVPLSLERDGEITVSAKMGDDDWKVVKRKKVVRIDHIATD